MDTNCCVHNINDSTHTVVVDPTTLQSYCTNCKKNLISSVRNPSWYVPDWTNEDIAIDKTEELINDSPEDAFDRAMKGIK